MAAQTETCTLCRDVVSVANAPGGVDGFLPGFAGWPNRSPLRWIVQGEVALLHHRCSHQTVRDMLDPDRNWFACMASDRPIDRDAVFDPFCRECEARWAAEGAAVWNV
jgi:hypothetical protein